ncbi:uncharacterized protein KQ657_003560 [Scheffersomyces spartinae]|uniref:ubiquitinyl hydrolase 1 n=1 Tax=Scheffersomyces spartinae TaxID=45513 RepID=A0A9P8AG67_9ASCO|nr:uncharacterized protein KQ657_003560 [Scheffersomyces spartinae]KAG7191319.1 hypothetical protein KQ657_003560 [Scheffersomyces spartinae]
MDYCELLYEHLKRKNNPDYYINGFIILNYFINSYIMMKYKGFDQLIAKSQIDFVVYLNLFSFYVNDNSILSNNEMGFPEIALLQLRTLVLEYLIDNQLLSFDVNELYNWLYEYIDYLRQKDKQEGLKKDNTGDTILNGLQNSPTDKDQDNDSFTTKFPSLEDPEPFIEFNESDSDSNTDNDGTLKSPSNASATNLARKRPTLPYPLNVTEEVTNLTPFIGETTPVLPRILTEPSISIDPEINQDKILKVARTTTDPILPLSKRPPQVIPPVPKTNTQYIRNSVNPPPKSSSPGKSVQLSTTVQTGNFTQPLPPKGNSTSSGRVAYNQKQNSSAYPPQQPPLPPQQFQAPWPQQQYTNNYPPPPLSQFPSSQQFPHNQQIYPQQFPPTQYYQGPQYPPQQIMNASYSNGYAPPMNVNPYKVYGICGLKNFGSSCYINLTLQVLFGLYYFKRLMQSLEIPRAPNSLAASILGLLNVFTNKGNSNITPANFIRTVKHFKPEFNVPFEQQDAQEFLIFVLDQLHNETRFKPQNTPVVDDRLLCAQKDKDEYAKWYDDLIKYEGLSPIHDLFQGHLQSKLICYKCSHESASYSSFTILSLPIPSSGSMVNLSDCLMYYTQDEVLKGDNAWKCPKCSKAVDALEGHRLDNNPVFHVKKSGIFKFKRSKSPSKEPEPIKLQSSAPDLLSLKRLTFVKLPKILFIHLSRFSNMQHKLTVPIKFPLKLNFEHDAEPVLYNLVGVINHFGSLKSGHYISVVNKMLDAKFHLQSPSSTNSPPHGWYLFDDEHIVNTSMGNNDTVESRDAYVLCYERL